MKSLKDLYIELYALDMYDNIDAYIQKQDEIIDKLQAVELEEIDMHIVAQITKDVKDLDFAGTIWANVEYNGRYDMSKEVEYIINRYIQLIKE